MIDGRGDGASSGAFPRRAGVIGHPVAHSLSPLIHAHVYQASGLPWDYGRFDCPTPDDVARLVRQARTAGDTFLGFNVTMPYKRDVMALVDGLDASAFMVGGANVLCFEASVQTGKRTLRGYNTDGYGVVRTLELDAGCSVAGATVIICGTGATALSSLVALRLAGAEKIVLVSRDAARAQAFVTSCQRAMEEALDIQGDVLMFGFGTERREVSDGVRTVRAADTVCVASYDELPALMPTADIFIDATPLGMQAGDPSVVAPALLSARHIVLDVVYGHGTTALVEASEAAGARVLDGLGMLVEQAIATMLLFAEAQGVSLTIDRAALYQALGRAALVH
jgi:shikimate 5-dehydrogenase